MKKYFMILALGIFLISFASALELDNVMRYEEETETITFVNAFGLGRDLAKAQLEENSCEDGRFCHADKRITLYEEGALIQEFRTLRLDDGSKEEKEIRSHSFKYWGEEGIYEIICTETKPIYQEANNTYSNPGRICEKVHVGTRENWVDFSEGDIFGEGTYLVRTVGEIKPGRVYDWQIKIKGDWTTPWAVWGNLTEGDDAEVFLNSPGDESTFSISLVTFNATANVTGGALLRNLSLYTNESGTWGIRNITTIAETSEGVPYDSSTPPYNSGMFGYYKLDELSGNTVIDSTNNVNGSITGSLGQGAEGIINTGYNFPGTDNNIIDVSTGAYPSNGTIALWAKLNSTKINQVLIAGVSAGSWGDVQIRQVTGGFLQGEIGDGISAVTEATTPIVPVVGTWYHISMTWGVGGPTKIYINGILNDTTANLGGMGTVTDVRIGNYWNNNAEFNGTLDEIGLWNRTLNASEIQSIQGSPPSFSTQTWNRTLAEGIIWNVEGCDSDGDCGFAPGNFTLFVEADAPIFTVESPVGTLDFGVIGGNEVLNVTFNDTNLEFCQFNYNGTDIEVEGCLSGIKNSTTFILEANNLNMTISANDSTSNDNSTFIEWDYKIIEINQTFSETTIEGGTESYVANVTLGDGVSISAVVLVYNGSNNVGATLEEGNNTIITLENFVIPQVSADVNITFFWSVVLSDTQVINLTSRNQTIANLNVDNCSSFTNQILNLSMVDEELQTPLENTTLEIAIDLLSQDRSQVVVSLSGSFTDENPVGICLNENITAGLEYSTDAVIRYTAIGYANEYFNLFNFTLNNESEAQNITLYDLNITDSTDFQLTFTGRDFIVVEDALVFVDRQYIAENTFKTVELPKTDSNGQTILHLVRNDIHYNIVVSKDGEILRTFTNIIAFCDDFTIGSCTLSLNALTNQSPVFNYDEGVGILYEAPPEYDSGTNEVSFDFVSADATPKVLLLEVERRDVFGNISVCNNTVVSTSGTLKCNIGQDLSDTRLYSTISVGGTEWINSDVLIDTSTYGTDGYLLWFLVVLLLVLMFSDSKNALMISMIVGYVLSVSLGWVVGGIIGLGAAGIWILLISIVGIWQINRRRSK